MPKKLEKHRYELPCASCQELVKLSAERWLKYSEEKRLPFCVKNGCNKYRKYLSADDTLLGD